MQNNYITLRLSLSLLSTDHTAFIHELVNTEGWLRFIGNRNVSDDESAVGYIQKILANEHVTYWVVAIKEAQIPIGIITFIKREYLAHPDIGFAFLPAYAGKGYAYEAAKAVLDDIVATSSPVLATTIPDNARSIQLLEKLGFSYEKEIEQDGEKLLVYSTE